jgi:hypothetical protein
MRKKNFVTLLLLLLATAAWAQATHKWTGIKLTATDSNGKNLFNFGNATATGTKTNTVPDNYQTVYLYNRGAKKFFSCGGHWGVEGKLHEVGMPVYLSKVPQGTFVAANSYLIKKGPIYDDAINNYSQNYVAYIWDNKIHLDERGVIIDRRRSWTNSEQVPSGEISLSMSTNWVFTQKTITDPDGVARTYCYISVTDDSSNTWYLCKNGGGGLRDDIVTVKNVNPDTQSNAEDYRWMIVSKQDMINDFAKTTASYVDMSDATFFVYDQNFSRKNGNESKWTFNKEAGSNTDFHISNAKYSDGDAVNSHTVTTDEVNVYTTHAAGETTYYNLLYGEFYNAELRNGNGSVYQNIPDLGTTGFYLLSVQGFYRPGAGSSMKGYIYAKSSTNGGENKDGWTKTYLPSIDSEGGTQPTDLTQSGIQFNADKKAYSVNLLVRVANTTDDLEIGFGMENWSSADDWVAVDNVQLRYVGSDYLISEYFQNTGYYPTNTQNYTVMTLERQFQLGQWNSLTLPVDLNVEQVKTAFGTDVKLATLKGLSDDGSTIQFESVDLSTKAYTDIVIEKNKFYLIKPYAEPRNYEMQWSSYSPTPDPATRNYPFYLVPGVYFDKANVGDHSETYTNTINHQSLTITNTTYYHQNDADKIPASQNNYYYVMNNGALTRWTTPFKFKGLRWYLNWSEAPTNARVAVMNYDQSTTGISVINTDTRRPSAKGIYTLDGRKISETPNTKGLPQGLYIVDGKKEWVY